MKTLLRALLAIFLFASPSWAAFGTVGTLGTCTSVVSGTTCVITTGATLEAGNAGVLIFASDNACTVAGNTNEHSTVVDSGGVNTYTKGREYCYPESGGAACAQFARVHKTSAAITVNGTPAGGNLLRIQGQVDATATTTAQVADVKIAAITITYAIAQGF